MKKLFLGVICMALALAACKGGKENGNGLSLIHI